VDASGNVYMKTFSPDKELIEAFSDRAKYFLEKEYGELWVNTPAVAPAVRPLIKYYMTGQTSPLLMKADKIVLDKVNGRLDAAGSAEFVSSSGTAHADNITLLQKEKKAIMTGKNKPYVIYTASGKNDRFEGDTMIYYYDKKIVHIEGNAKGKIKDYKTYKNQ
jgi:hypothetical protein